MYVEVIKQAKGAHFKLYSVGQYSSVKRWCTVLFLTAYCLDQHYLNAKRQFSVLLVLLRICYGFTIQFIVQKYTTNKSAI